MVEASWNGVVLSECQSECAGTVRLAQWEFCRAKTSTETKGKDSPHSDFREPHPENHALTLTPGFSLVCRKNILAMVMVPP